MFEELLFPWVSLSLLAPLLAALATWRAGSAERARGWACAALGVSTLALLAARVDAGRGAEAVRHLEPWRGGPVAGWFGVDALNAVPLPLFAALALGVVAFAPRRKVSARWVTGVLLVTAATLTAYAAENLPLLVLGWTASTLPFLTGQFFTVRGEQEVPRLSRWVLCGSVLCLAAGVAVLMAGRPESAGGWYDASPLPPPDAAAGAWERTAFLLLIAAVFLRKGLAPFHSWIVTAFERGPLLPLALLVNGHLGAFLVARVAIPLLPAPSREFLPLLGDLGLLTAAYTAFVALAEPQPRRLLALLGVSQASFILVGLESTNADGIAGALVHWQVVAVATTVLAAVYTALEARVGTALDRPRFLGLALGAPRLAVCFLVGALALVGMPLTLGFCAEDLLLHGTLATHPRLGFVMPAVTALNAFSVLRLFARLFLGPAGPEARGLADALPRERRALAAALVFLVAGGLAPGPLLRLPAAAAERLAGIVAPGRHAVEQREAAVAPGGEEL
jgi:NADH-quinone oxidoreductase subunit M